MAIDILVENARIVDGTGAPWFRGSVGIEDGSIAAVDREKAHGMAAETTVDVDGSVLAPGFIDTHSHSDLELFSNPTLAPKVRQGITTEILGQDGFSMGPMYREGGEADWRQHVGALAGHTDRDWTWGSLGEYLAAIEANGVAPNVATLVGHGTVRFNVLGMADRDPTDTELAEMADLVSESLDEGAIGFSTGLIYTPGAYGDTEELRRLASRLAPSGRPFVAHIRSEGRWIWEALDEFIDIGAAESIPLHVSHFKVAGTAQHGKAERALETIEMARERGIDVTVEQYPYTAGSTMLSAVLPPWVHADGPEQALAHLRDPASRERIKRDIQEWRIDGWENIGALSGWDNVVISHAESATNTELEGRSIAELAADQDTDSVATVCDVLVETELAVSIVIHFLAEEDVRTILAGERVNVGTDGLFGGQPHPRVYGTYPRILGQYVRDENLLTLEEAVRKMTALPARAMGLQSKGVIRAGMDADLVVFDPDIIRSRATYEDPKRYPIGIPDVMVNGQWIVRDSELTGELPGTVIRQ